MTAARVDHDLCAGVAMCVAIAPGAFELDDAGQSVFRSGGAWTEADLEEAADSCPMAAIALLPGTSTPADPS
jgi:ferredoxin